jgi:predicted kinase
VARTSRRREWDADLLEESIGPQVAGDGAPGLVILVGLPGAGKSSFARALKARLPVAVLDSDALRTALFPQPQHKEAENKRLFPAIHVLVERLLKGGVSVVMDATNLKEANRRPLYRMAAANGTRLVLVRVWAPVRVVRERLRGRAIAGGPADRSTADWEVYQRMREDAEPVHRRHLSVDTSKDFTAALDKVVAILQS